MRLIDADACLDNINATIDEATTLPIPVDGVYLWDLINYALDSAPTVDAVEVRHGHYIGTEYDGYADGAPVYSEWQCSECGCLFEDDEPFYAYCPHCGAKMDGGENNAAD